jgi:hypothetical protein
MVVGTASLAGAWRHAALIWEWPRWPGELLALVAFAVWILLVGSQMIKWITAQDKARQELENWVNASLSALAFVASLLIANLMLAWSTDLATAFFLVRQTGLAGNGFDAVGGGRHCLADTGIHHTLSLADRTTSRIVTAPVVRRRNRPTCGFLPGVAGTFPRRFQSASVGVHGVGPAADTVEYRAAALVAGNRFVPGYWSFSFGAGALAACSAQLSGTLAGASWAISAKLVLLCSTSFILWLWGQTLSKLLIGKLFPGARLTLPPG